MTTSRSGPFLIEQSMLVTKDGTYYTAEIAAEMDWVWVYDANDTYVRGMVKEIFDEEYTQPRSAK